MRAEEVRALSTTEIISQVTDAKEELMNLRFQLLRMRGWLSFEGKFSPGSA